MNVEITQLTVHASDDPAEPEQLRQQRARRIADQERRVEARRAARSFRKAAERTHSPSDRLACYLDIRLEQHPELLATEADYPGWAEHIAALQAANRTTRKEGTS